MENAACEAAMAAARNDDFSQKSFNHVLSVIGKEADFGTRSGALMKAQLAYEAYKRQRELGNYGRATAYLVATTSATIGVIAFGNSQKQTIENMAEMIVLGAFLGELQGASTRSQIASDIAAKTTAGAMPRARAFIGPRLPNSPKLPNSRIVLDLFGGKKSQVPGAINVDTVAESGVKASVLEGLPFKSGSVDEIIATNPYLDGLPSNTNAGNTWMPEAARVLKKGGKMTVTGTKGNKFAKMPTKEVLDALGLRVVKERGAITDPRISGQEMHQTSGEPIPNSCVSGFVLEKK